jgi:hypothetical protein
MVGFVQTCVQCGAKKGELPSYGFGCVYDGLVRIGDCQMELVQILQERIVYC